MLRAVDIAWAAGFLEGEGSFNCRGMTVIVTASQVQPEPLYRLQHLFGGKLYRYTHKNPSHNPFMRWHLYNRPARELMMTIYGLMSPKRHAQIVNALAPWRTTQQAPRLRTHCPRGHPYSIENTYLTKRQSRACRICSRAWVKNSPSTQRRRALIAVHQVDITET